MIPELISKLHLTMFLGWFLICVLAIIHTGFTIAAGTYTLSGMLLVVLIAYSAWASKLHMEELIA